MRHHANHPYDPSPTCLRCKRAGSLCLRCGCGYRRRPDWTIGEERKPSCRVTTMLRLDGRVGEQSSLPLRVQPQGQGRPRLHNLSTP
uniref:Uncharacterized protein n=1 Tax=Zea mays TaxID=4577 RepID=C0PIT8_MAIZE|nr:unknown [Zea mays]